MIRFFLFFFMKKRPRLDLEKLPAGFVLKSTVGVLFRVDFFFPPWDFLQKTAGISTTGVTKGIPCPLKISWDS